MLAQGNQQITSISSWFTGIIEGEGCFSTHKNEVLTIHNTDLGIIEPCENYLDENYIRYETNIRYRYPRKKLYVITIQRFKGDIYNPIKYLYDLIEPHLQCRRDECERLLGISSTVRPLSIDHSWMIGIWEAEGTLSLTLRRVKDRRSPFRTNFSTSLENTNEKIINKILLNLKEMYIPHHISFKEAKENCKEVWRIEICGMKRCHTFLKSMENRWISPRNQKRSSLMLEFIRTRLDMHKLESYSARQFQIIQAMSDLNR